MSFFDKKESANFLYYCFTHPFEGLRYSFEFLFFLVGNIKMKVEYKFSSDKHSVRKRLPAWLNSKCTKTIFFDSKSILFDFPSYKRSVIDLPLINGYNIAFENDTTSDIEEYYKKNRWVFCLYAISGDSYYSELAVKKINEWIDVRSDKNDLAWESYSTGERVVNSAILFSYKPELLLFLDNTKYFIFINDSLQWIASHLEYYGDSETNNHFLNNARALIIGGVVINDESKIKLGVEIVQKYCPVLFNNSGILRERSSHYQVIITNWMLDILHFIKFKHSKSAIYSNNVLYLERLVKEICISTEWLIKHFGVKVLVGDISPDLSPELSVIRLRLLYKEFIDEIIDSDKFLLERDWFNFKEGMLSVNGILFEGEFPFRYPTHGHNDLCSFNLFYDNFPIIIDSGRFNYKKQEISIKQKSGYSHNTILINGLSPLSESLILNGNYFPRPYSTALINLAYSDSSLRTISVSHNGFERLNKVGKHERIIALNNGFLNLQDIIEGDGTVNVEILFHFMPEFIFVPDSKKILLSNSIHNVEFEIEVENSQLKVEYQNHQFYYSSNYGEYKKAQRIRFFAKVQLPCKINTKIFISLCAV